MDENYWAILRICLAWLRPVILVAGLAVCYRNRKISVHMPWLIGGFGILVVDWLLMFMFSLSGAGRSFFASRSYYTTLIGPWAWGFVVVGLALVMRDHLARTRTSGRAPETVTE